MRRRRFLAATGAAVAAVGTGCLGDRSDGPGTEPEPRSRGTTATTAPETTTGAAAGRTTEPPSSVETIQIGPRNQPTGWDRESAIGRVVVIDSTERARAALPRDELSRDRAATVRRFVEDTDFGRSTLLFVQSAGPNGCYDTLAVEDVTVNGGEIRGTAAAVDGSEGSMCVQMLTFPGALVRVTVPDAPPTEATLTVTDGWGETGTVSARAADPLALRR